MPDSDDNDRGYDEKTAVTQDFESLQQTVEEEKAKTERLQQIVYQLLGGLYNHTTQEKTLMFKVDYLFVEEKSDTEEEFQLRAQEYIFPTTRQGDDNASRIDLLHKEINDLKEEIHNKIYGAV